MTTEQTKAETLQTLTEMVEYYYELSESIKRLEMTKDIVKDRITGQFEVMGNPAYYDTPAGLRARLQVRFRESIKVEEARSLLPQEFFDKLLKVTEYQSFTVRQLKEEKE